ncbi:MAG: hypothetical protein HYY18_12845 [Planctomycetes bacterium]|nr:hypothetical protein [Planctomycetota bacterium]
MHQRRAPAASPPARNPDRAGRPGLDVGFEQHLDRQHLAIGRGAAAGGHESAGARVEADR